MCETVETDPQWPKPTSFHGYGTGEEDAEKELLTAVPSATRNRFSLKAKRMPQGSQKTLALRYREKTPHATAACGAPADSSGAIRAESTFRGLGFPALTGWANFCRASGAKARLPVTSRHASAHKD